MFNSPTNSKNRLQREKGKAGGMEINWLIRCSLDSSSTVLTSSLSSPAWPLMRRLRRARPPRSHLNTASRGPSSSRRTLQWETTPSPLLPRTRLFYSFPCFLFPISVGHQHFPFSSEILYPLRARPPATWGVMLVSVLPSRMFYAAGCSTLPALLLVSPWRVVGHHLTNLL